MEDKYVIAIDLGGTKLRVAYVDSIHRIHALKIYSTNAEAGRDLLIKRLLEITKKYITLDTIKNGRLCGIAVSIAGLIDDRKGIVTFSPHLPGWIDVPLQDIIQREFKLETRVINDVNAAILGELNFGKGRKYNNFIYIAIGTGIGGGIVIDGRLYGGKNGAAGEFGHMVINTSGPKCYCGNRGCLEALVSGSAIEREAKQAMKYMTESLLKHKLTDLEITAKRVFFAAKNGDKESIKIIRKSSYYLGVGITNLIHIFNPEAIIFGGSLSKNRDILIQPAVDIALKNTFKLSVSDIKFMVSALGDRVGLLGASTLFI